jgi:hypothetical protein
MSWKNDRPPSSYWLSSNPIQTSVRVVDLPVGLEILANTEERFGWYGKETGALAPQFDWCTEHLGKDTAI